LVGKPEGNISLGRPSSRQDDINIHLQEVRYGVDWTDQAPDMNRWQALAKTLMDLRVP
jgi:hypothetical protein